LETIISEKLKVHPKEWTPEMITLTLYLKKKLSLKLTKVNDEFMDDNILHSSNIKLLKNAFIASSSIIPKVHSLWKKVLDYVFEEVESLSLAQDIWQNIVESELFNSTVNRKYLGFKLFSLFKEKVNLSDISLFLTPNFLSCLISNLTNKKKLLGRISLKTIDELVEEAKKDPHNAIAIISTLQGVNGHHAFDIVTKTKTIRTLLQSLNADICIDYIQSIIPKFYEGDSDNNIDESSKANIINARRIWVLEQIATLSSNELLLEKMDYLISILRFYFFHSFYDLNEENYTKRDQLDIWNFKLDTPIHNKIRSRCSQKFFSLLRSMNKKYEKEDLVYKIYLFQEEIEKENIGYPSRDLEENLQTSDIDIKNIKKKFF